MCGAMHARRNAEEQIKIKYNTISHRENDEIAHATQGTYIRTLFGASRAAKLLNLKR